METELEPFSDIHGFERRCGTLSPDAGMLKAFAAMPGALPDYTDAQIKELLTDPARVKMKDIFGKLWIQNQLSFGSCNGWGTTGCLGRVRFLAGIRDMLQFSGSYVYSWINGNRDQGSMLSDGLTEIGIHGAPPVALNPANKIYRSQIPASVDAEAAKYKGLVQYPVKTLQGLKTALARNMPCVVAVHAASNFQRANSKGVAGADNGPGNHAVCCEDIEIIDGELVYRIANSWGISFGVDGYIYVREATFRQTFPNHTFWALAAIQEG